MSKEVQEQQGLSLSFGDIVNLLVSLPDTVLLDALQHTFVRKQKLAEATQLLKETHKSLQETYEKTSST